MTTAAIKDGLRASAGPGMGRDFGLVLAIILATLAGIFAAALSAASARTGSGVADAAAAPALPVAAPRPAILRATRRDADSVEALIDAAARRYRISGTAMGEFIDMAFAEARRHRLDPLLIVAVMAVESRFNPVAQSDAGAKGLMQVIPHFHPEKFSATGGKSALDPRTNIKVGVQVLKEYIDRGGNEAAGLQLYNGASRDSSNTYANKVLSERARLQSAMRRGREQAGTRLAVLG
ncbi:MAG: transglycosylase SLT domain-containing protein [Betaproteobacteria bacterium]|nr:transglycosylase SLT domain-containing protein [Betaproteobacteria bacterium]